MKEVITIQGAWSDEANGWESEVLTIRGDAYLEVTLPGKGHLVIKKAVPSGHCGCTESVTWPKALITPWTGPDFKIRLYGSTEHQHIKIITTDTPKSIHYAYI
jgi:hypothetical protein